MTEFSILICGLLLQNIQNQRAQITVGLSGLSYITFFINISSVIIIIFFSSCEWHYSTYVWVTIMFFFPISFFAT